MKRIGIHLLMLVFVLACAGTASGNEFSLEFGHFGKLAIYCNSSRPSHVVLFVSGDGGWNLGVVDMARALAGLDSLVVGIDINTYFDNIKSSKKTCIYSAADFEYVSKFVQKKLGFSKYRIPILVGYSSGATLVYAVMIQAPYNTFQGAISLGFCPSLMKHPHLCQMNALRWRAGPKDEMLIQPFKGESKPWIAFQGEIDQECNPKVTEAFVKQASNAKLVLLPKVGHGFSVQRNWLPQFKKEFTELINAQAKNQPHVPESLSDLPVVELPAKPPANDVLAVLLTGDGGWAGLDRDVSAALAERGVSVVGFSTLKYFWTARTPDEAGKDLERVLNYYLEKLKKNRIILIGYSLGADVLPFMASRLPKELLDKTALAVLLSPGGEARFEFHISQWLGGSNGKGMPTLPEINKLSGINLLCICGNDDTNCICPKIFQKNAKIVTMPGGHHFDGDYSDIADKIMAALAGVKSHD